MEFCFRLLSLSRSYSVSLGLSVFYRSTAEQADTFFLGFEVNLVSIITNCAMLGISHIVCEVFLKERERGWGEGGGGGRGLAEIDGVWEIPSGFFPQDINIIVTLSMICAGSVWEVLMLCSTSNLSCCQLKPFLRSLHLLSRKTIILWLPLNIRRVRV